jgi:hypothetical protein
VDEGNGLIWDTAIFLHPVNGTMLYISFAIPGAVADTILNHGVAIKVPWSATREGLLSMFTDAMTILKSNRSAQLTEEMARLPDLRGVFGEPGAN